MPRSLLCVLDRQTVGGSVVHRTPKFIILILVLTQSPSFGQQAKGKVAGEIFKAGIRLLTGAAAAESMRRAGNASVEHQSAVKQADLTRSEYERVRRERIDGVVRQFHSQGLSDEHNTIYSAFLDINYNAGSVYWADTFSNPDIFFVVEVEGIGQFILPNIRNEYKGGPVLDRIVLPELAPGSRVVVRVLDDDTSGDAIWNSILRSRVNYKFSIDNQMLYATQGFHAQADLSGGFQILDTPQRVVLDGPDQIATVVFQVPSTSEKTWVADGELRDSNNRVAGRVQFSQVWNTRAELATLERELGQQVSQAEQKESSSFGWLIFWVVLGLVCLSVFFKSLFEKFSLPGSKPPISSDSNASLS